MVQQEESGDYALATGETNSVRSFSEKAFRAVDIKLTWEGEGAQEKGYDAESGRCLIEAHPGSFRPVDVDSFCGDPSRARQELGWEPHNTLEVMVEEMVEANLAQARDEELLNNVQSVKSG